MVRYEHQTVAHATKPCKRPTERTFWEKDAFLILILLSLCYVLFFFHLGAHPLWDGDEGMHAATSKDMILSGDWITPTFNGEKFYDKPVLYNWFVSLSFLVFGFNEFAARLPSAILGAGCILVTYLLGRCLFGPTVGFLSGVILAASGEQIVLSRVVVHDIALSFFVLLSLFFFYSGFKDEERRRRYLLLFYASSGFSVLAKGPVGLLLPALIIGLFLLVRRRIAFLREFLTLWGILLFFTIASPWYLLILLRNREYGSYFFIQQNVMNFLSSEARHSGPIYYYLSSLLVGFFPWSCFLPMALIHALRGGLKEMDERLVFLSMWFLVIFVFFSVASSKLDTYILPLYPAASCLVGVFWNSLLKAPTSELRRRFVYSFILLLGISVAGIGYLWLNPLTYLKIDYGLDMAHLKYYGLAFLPLPYAAFGIFLRRNFRASFLALVGTVVSSILFLLLVIVPLMNPYRSTKGFGKELDRMLPPGEKMVFARVMRDSAVFYTNRQAVLIHTREELIKFLGSGKRVFLIIRKSLFENNPRLAPLGHVIAEEGHKAIISNQR